MSTHQFHNAEPGDSPQPHPWFHNTEPVAQQTTMARIDPPRAHNPWKKVIVSGGVSGVAFVIMATLAMIDGATGIPLKHVAGVFALVFFLIGILSIVLAVRVGCQLFLVSDRHKNAKWKANR